MAHVKACEKTDLNDINLYLCLYIDVAPQTLNVHKYVYKYEYIFHDTKCTSQNKF